MQGQNLERRHLELAHGGHACYRAASMVLMTKLARQTSSDMDSAMLSNHKQGKKLHGLECHSSVQAGVSVGQPSRHSPDRALHRQNRELPRGSMKTRHRPLHTSPRAASAASRTLKDPSAARDGKTPRKASWGRDQEVEVDNELHETFKR